MISWCTSLFATTVNGGYFHPMLFITFLYTCTYKRFRPILISPRLSKKYSFLLTQLLKERFEFARSFNLTAENISLHTVCFIMQYLVCDWTKFARCCTCTNTSCGFCIFYFHKVLLTLSIDTIKTCSLWQWWCCMQMHLVH